MMTKFDPRTTLLIVALENELPRDLVAVWQIVYIGVGKLNAAITLCDALAYYKPQRVINDGGAAHDWKEQLVIGAKFFNFEVLEKHNQFGQ